MEEKEEPRCGSRRDEEKEGNMEEEGSGKRTEYIRRKIERERDEELRGKREEEGEEEKERRESR